MGALEEAFAAHSAAEATLKKDTMIKKFNEIVSDIIVTKRKDPFANGNLHTVARTRMVETVRVPERRTIFGRVIPAYVEIEIQRFTELLVLFEIFYIDYAPKAKLYASSDGELFSTSDPSYSAGRGTIVATVPNLLYQQGIIQSVVRTVTEPNVAMAIHM